MESKVIDRTPTACAEDQQDRLEGSCLACYLERTVPRDGCDGLTLTQRWISAQTVPVVGLLEWLKSQGGYCDCEVLYNVFGSRGSNEDLPAFRDDDAQFSPF